MRLRDDPAQTGRVEAAEAALLALILARFRAEQAETGLTQADLARRLGVPRSQVGAWFAGRQTLSFKAAVRLAAAMGADLVCSLSLSAEAKD